MALLVSLMLAALPLGRERYENYLRERTLADLRRLALIAHAGGLRDRPEEANSISALEASFQSGHRFFELDFSWTADRILVGVHTWTEGSNDAELRRELPDLAAVRKVKPHTITLSEACEWLQRRAGHLITDVKSDRVTALREIKAQCGTTRIIPQVHNRLEYQLARRLGYKNIIVTLYRSEDHPDLTWKEYGDESLLAVAVPVGSFAKYNSEAMLGRTCLLTHTVNDWDAFLDLRQLGVCGVYSDSLAPASQRLN